MNGKWKKLSAVVVLMVLVYLGSFFYFYVNQDAIFKSESLPSNYNFEFDEQFEELNFTTEKGGVINALFFHTDSARGVVCFWKGNGGTIQDWGKLAPKFLKLNYDVIISDYRQHGKSKGEITMLNFYNDSQVIYDFLKSRFVEKNIINVGYSLGTAMATHIAANNNPGNTILIEPIKNFTRKKLQLLFPFTTVNQFPFRLDQDIKNSKKYFVIITGKDSHLYSTANKLKGQFLEDITFFEIAHANHVSILENKELETILAHVL